jgi:hypothetical protein
LATTSEYVHHLCNKLHINFSNIPIPGFTVLTWKIVNKLQYRNNFI